MTRPAVSSPRTKEHMSTSLMLAWSEPTSAEATERFEAWYEHVHIPQVRKTIRSITSVDRYVLNNPDAAPSSPPVNRYLTVYGMDSADVAAAQALLMEAVRSGHLDMTDSLNPDRSHIEWYVERHLEPAEAEYPSSARERTNSRSED